MKKINCPNLAKNLLVLLILSLVFAVLFSGSIYALSSDNINLQGKIVRNDIGHEGMNVIPGSPACVVNGPSNDTCDFRVSYYTALTGGTLLLTEDFTNVEIGQFDGVFELSLGSGTVTTTLQCRDGTCNSPSEVISEYGDLYVELQFAPDGSTLTETFTRMPLEASPYAIFSKFAEGAHDAFKLSTSVSNESLENPSAGMIYFDTGSSQLKVYNGAEWQGLSAGTSSSLWTDAGTYSYLTSTTDDLVLGGSTFNTGRFVFDMDGGSGSYFDVFNNDHSNKLFTILSSGNVGIGTATPGAKLEVGGAASTITNSTGNLTISTGGGNGNILLMPNGTGKVGIGTTSPGVKLDVAGQGRFESTVYPVVDIIRDTGSAGGGIYGGARLQRKTTSPTSGGGIGFFFWYPNSNGVLEETGMFGGALADTTAGSEIGEIIFGASYHGVDPYTQRHLIIRAVNSSQGEVRTPYRLKIGADSSPSQALDVTGNAIISGNVGIGITNPTHKLELASHTTASGGIGFGTDVELYRSNTNTLSLASGDNFNLVSGNVQIGSTTILTSGRLVQAANGSVSSPAFSFSSDTNTGMYGTGSDTLSLVTNGTDRITINASGNVGIGTTSPTAYLHLKAGTTSANTAPLKFTTGANLATPESGAMEWDGSRLYITNITPTRNTIAYLSDLSSFITQGYQTVQEEGSSLTQRSILNFIGSGITAVDDSPNSRTNITLDTKLNAFADLVSSAGVLTNNGSGGLSWVNLNSGDELLPVGTEGQMLYNNAGVWTSFSGMYWDDTNNRLGIGTTTPSEKLEIVGRLKMDDETMETTSVTFDGDTTAGLKLSNPRGYITLTPLNTGWAHIYTDRSNFIFDKPVYSYANVFSSYNNDLQLRRAGTTEVVIGSTRTTITDNLSVNGTSYNYFSGNIGIGTTSPTAYLHLKAGTSSANTAPLKFTTGANLATPESGAMEWDGSRLYITNTTPTRNTIAYLTDIVADTDNYVDSVSFNTGDGVLTLGRTGTLPDLTTDLDGRYLQTEADTLQSVTNRGATTTVSSSFTGGATIRGLIVDDATATHDRILTTVASVGTARYDGTLTNADLTAARTWTLPDKSGTVAMTSDIPVSDNYQYWVLQANGAAGSNITSTSAVSFNGSGIVTTSRSGNTITITGTEADTLASVTGRGASTTVASLFTGGATIRGLIVDSATATDDRILTSITTGGSARYDGTLTNVDLTAARTWTLPNATGTIALGTGTTSQLAYWTSTNTLGSLDYSGWDTNVSDDVTNFLGLTDTPGSYSGSGNYLVRVNSTATALEFVEASAFTDTDNYVDSVDFNAVNGVLTLGRTGALSDLTTSLDGRYALSSAGMPTGTEGQMLYNNAGVWTSFSGMYWDDTNNRLGIGTTSPTQKLEVAGNVYMNDGYLMQDDIWGMKWQFAGTSDTVEMNQAETAWKFNVGGGGVTKYRFNSTKSGSINGPILDLEVGGNSIFYGKVGIGTTSPTAYLHLKAGTSSANTAPLKFTTGANLATPESGAMEWDGSRLYITNTTPTRNTIAYTSDIPASDNYGSWTARADTGADQSVTSGYVLDFEGSGGVATSITANKITIGTTGVLEDLNTLGAATVADQFIVSTAAGTFAYETGVTARTSLGATTVGSNLFTLANPSAVTFLRINADNSISTLDATSFRAAIGAGTGNGTVTSVATGTGLTGGTITTTGTISLDYSNTLGSNGLAANNTVFGSTGVLFEGSSSDTSETLLTVTNPTADNTITLPNSSGTIALTSDIPAGHNPVTLIGENYLSLSGQQITANKINLTSNVTGTLPIGSGGTNSTTYTSNQFLWYSGGSIVASGYDQSSFAGSGHSHNWSQITNEAGIYMNYKPNNTACGANQVLKYDTTNSRWICADDNAGTGGDNWGSQVVITNSTLTGNGTSGSPLGIALNNANTWTGMQTFRGLTVDSATATDDRILTSITTVGSARYDGTLTNADLTAARTWTLPDATGTIALGTGTTSQLAYWTSTNTLGSLDYSGWDTNASDDVTTFLGLTDTPISYSGSGNYLVRVNSAATALEFVEASAFTDTDNYVDSVDFAPGSGVLTLGRTGTLPDLTTSLDGRYLQSLRWDEIQNPQGYLTLDHGMYSTLFTFNSITSSTAFSMTSSSLATGYILGLSTTSTALTEGGVLDISADGTPSSSWTGNLARIEYNNGSSNVNGSALKVGLLGASAGSGTALNVTTSQTGATALALRVNDDSTYTDPSPFVVDKNGNVGVGVVSPTSKLVVNTLGYSTIELQYNDTPVVDIFSNVSSNIFIGLDSGSVITSGYGNIALGDNALSATTTGTSNTAIGYYALDSNVAKQGSTAIGYQAMMYADNTTTQGLSYNTAVGYQALVGSPAPSSNTGMYNTVVGHQSMTVNTTGSYNSALGVNTLINNTIGQYNVAVGYGALFTNVAKNASIAIGYEAMRYADNTTTTGTSGNIAVGYQALKGSTTASNNTGTNNIALGYQSLYGNTSGYDNVSIGSYAGNAITTGSNNSLFGYSAGSNLTTGSNNIIIGANINADSATGSNQLNIGGAIKGDLSTGDVSITRNLGINGVAYTWPNAQGSGLLTNNGSGGLSWNTSADLGLVSGTGSAGQVSYWNGTTSIEGSDNFWWDSTNSRLGIGTNNPMAKLDVVGSISGGANSKSLAQNNFTFGVGGTTDGELDEGFPTKVTGANNTVTSLAIQTDGKIVIGGSFTTYNNASRGRIARLLISVLYNPYENSFLVGFGSSRMYIDNTKVNFLGNSVGINLSDPLSPPSAMLAVRGITSDSTAAALKITNLSDDSLLFVRNDGNVGIGVTSPTYRLQLPNTADNAGKGQANAWVTYSDISLKENIQTISGGLDKIMALRGVTFDWKGQGVASSGFIAQEVEPIIPDLVSTDINGIKSLDYGRFTPYLVEAIKEQQLQIQTAYNRIEQLENINENKIISITTPGWYRISKLNTNDDHSNIKINNTSIGSSQNIVLSIDSTLNNQNINVVSNLTTGGYDITKARIHNENGIKYLEIYIPEVNENKISVKITESSNWIATDIVQITEEVNNAQEYALSGILFGISDKLEVEEDNVKIAGDLLSLSVNSSIGDSANRWNDIYAKGTIRLGSGADGEGAIRFNVQTKTLEFSNNGVEWLSVGDLSSQMTISPEYAGAILFADGSDNSGIMTSDAIEESGSFKNYYEWVSNKDTPQDYDILVRITLPTDFLSWKEDAIYLDIMTENSVSTDNNSVGLSLIGNSGTDVQITGGISKIAGAWERMSIKGADITQCNSAGGTCTLRISLTSSMEYFTRVGDITLNYNRSL